MNFDYLIVGDGSAGCVLANRLSENKNHKVGIFEIGTNDFGEINELSSILQPEVGVITSIGKAHLE